MPTNEVFISYSVFNTDTWTLFMYQYQYIIYIYLGIKKINKFFLNRQGLSSSYHVLRTTEHSPGDGRKIKLKYKSAPFTLTTLFFNFTSKALMRQTESLLL